MTIIENLVLLNVLLTYPITIYLIYIAYVYNMDLKQKNLFLDFALLSSLFLTIKYTNNRSLYCLLFYNIPLIIAFIRKKKVTSLILSFIIVYFTNRYTNISLQVIAFEYIFYYIGFLILIKTSHKEANIINGFLCVKSFFIPFIIFFMNKDASFFMNIYYVLVTISTFIVFTYINIYLLKKGEDIVNLNNLMKETKHQQYLYESLSKLTHELKNPIAVCKGYLEMINNNGYSKVKEYIPVISNEVNRSLTVINDFSAIGKLKSLDKEELDLELLLKEVISTLNPLFKKEQATINLNICEEIYLFADYNRLKQVFVNILKNSLEARKNTTPLEVIINVKKHKGIVKIIITDNGIGMDKEALSNINKIFYTTKANGTGLGVVLSTEIIEMHNGSIKYQSTKDVGTTVFITLPLKDSNL